MLAALSPQAGTGLFGADEERHNKLPLEPVEAAARRLLCAFNQRGIPITKQTVYGVVACVRWWPPTDPADAPELCRVLGCNQDAGPGSRWCREHTLPTQDRIAA